MSIWSKLNHFSANEGWGIPRDMDHGFLLTLDSARSFLNTPFVLTQGGGNSGSHTKNSQHYKGMAGDFVMPDTKKHPFDILIALERFAFTGIGYYPEWEYAGRKVGGWHLDCRELKDQYSGGARWMGVPDGEGNQKYVGLSLKNFKKYGVL